MTGAVVRNDVKCLDTTALTTKNYSALNVNSDKLGKQCSGGELRGREEGKQMILLILLENKTPLFSHIMSG